MTKKERIQREQREHDFLELCSFLETHHFTITRRDKTRILVAVFRNNVIRGGFDTAPGTSSYTCQKLAADHIDCFDKWANCPLILTIPKTPKDRDKLLGYFKFLGSKEGLKWSKSYAFLKDPKLPCEV